MPSGATGTIITLDATYQDGNGVAVTPSTPLIAIVDSGANVLVSGGVPTAVGPAGEFTYDYDIPDAGPAGIWTSVWFGDLNGAPVSGASTFTVTAGSVVFPSSECPSAPMWVTAEEYVALYPEATLAEAEAAIQEATWILWNLTGQRFHGIECRTDEYQGRPGLCRIQLYHWPVDEVFSVERVDDCTDEATVVDTWCYLSGGMVRLCCHGGSSVYGWPFNPWYSDIVVDPRMPCSCDDSVVRIQYRVQSNLPPGASRQVLKLAHEFWKSSQGQACALPERITNVTRQGVTWITLDPLDFLDKGLTGIGSIDQWISATNGLGYASLIDPLTSPRLLTSTLTGCGAACGAV